MTNSTAPVFVFAAGWRSGSTLLQRMLTASREILVWGEAGGALECLADAWIRYEQMLGPGGTRFRHGFGGNGAQEFEAFVEAGQDGVNQWIACMNPPSNDIQTALGAALDRIYGQPARDLGYPRWGVKEVRSGIDTVKFIEQISPDAKFVLLVRNPFHCLESIKRRSWVDGGACDDPLQQFARHWERLARQFRLSDFVIKMKFEDLTSNADEVTRLARYLELENIPFQFPDRSRADWKPTLEEGLSRREKKRLRRIVEEEMHQWGYTVGATG